MMTAHRRRLTVALAMAAIVISGCSTPGAFFVRPITVDVVDEETSKPIAGVQVQQVVIGDIYGVGAFGIVPSLERDTSTYYSNKQQTSEQGIAAFGKREIWKGFNEYITDELIIVNFDVDAHWDRYFESEADKRTRALMIFGIAPSSTAQPHLVYPNPKYGAVVVFSSVQLYSGKDAIEATRPYQVVRVNGGLTKEADRLTVHLRRK
jgi:hypothetical protein